MNSTTNGSSPDNIIGRSIRCMEDMVGSPNERKFEQMIFSHVNRSYHSRHSGRDTHFRRFYHELFVPFNARKTDRYTRYAQGTNFEGKYAVPDPSMHTP